MQCITIVFLLNCFWSAECSVWDGSLLRVRNYSEGIIVNDNSTLYIESGGSLIIEKYSEEDRSRMIKGYLKLSSKVINKK